MKKTSKEEQTHVTMEMTSLRQSDVTPDMASATDNLPDVRMKCLSYKRPCLALPRV